MDEDALDVTGWLDSIAAGFSDLSSFAVSGVTGLASLAADGAISLSDLFVPGAINSPTSMADNSTALASLPNSTATNDHYKMFEEGTGDWTHIFVALGTFWQIYQCFALLVMVAKLKWGKSEPEHSSSAAEPERDSRALHVLAAGLGIGGVSGFGSAVVGSLGNAELGRTLLAGNFLSNIITGPAFAVAGGIKQTVAVGSIFATVGVPAAASVLYEAEVESVLGVSPAAAAFIKTASIQAVLFLHGVIGAALGAAAENNIKTFASIFPAWCGKWLKNCLNINIKAMGVALGQAFSGERSSLREFNLRYLQSGIFYLITVGILGLFFKEFFALQKKNASWNEYMPPAVAALLLPLLLVSLYSAQCVAKCVTRPCASDDTPDDVQQAALKQSLLDAAAKMEAGMPGGAASDHSGGDDNKDDGPSSASGDGSRSSIYPSPDSASPSSSRSSTGNDAQKAGAQGVFRTFSGVWRRVSEQTDRDALQREDSSIELGDRPNSKRGAFGSYKDRDSSGDEPEPDGSGNNCA